MVVTSDIDEKVKLGPLGDLVGYHMRRASSIIGTDFARAMAGTGMRQVLFGILSIVDANPGINQGSVGRALGIQRANMVSLVNELIDAGYVTREVTPEDRRAFSLSLSEAGRARLVQSLATIRKHETAVLADLSVAERKTLIALIDRIRSAEN